MGCAINSYTIIKELETNGDKIIIDLISQYNLFAFVIHDPDKHYELDKTINNDFELLDYATGSKLLFFTFFNVPEKYNQYIKKKFQPLDPCQFVDKNFAPTTKNKSETSYTIAKHFNIPLENLPCIVVFNNFKTQEFMHIKTDEHLIKLQFLELGYLANEMPKFKDNYNFTLTKINNKYNNLSISNSKIIKSDINMLNELSTIINLLILDDENYFSHNEEEAIKKINAHIHELKNKLENEKKVTNKNEIDKLKKIEKISEQLSQCVIKLNRKYIKITDLTFLNTFEKYIDKNSYIYLQTAIKFYSILKNFRNRKYQFEFIAVTIGIGKAFETEINLSIVHFIRQYLGIKLPDYYNKVQPKSRNINMTPDKSLCDDTPNPINFNKKRKSEWVPPSLGQSLMCFKTLRLQKKIDEKIISTQSANILTACWEKIVKIRNDSVHGNNRIITEDNVKTLITAIKELSDNGIFELLSKLKKKYSKQN